MKRAINELQEVTGGITFFFSTMPRFPWRFSIQLKPQPICLRKDTMPLGALWYIYNLKIHLENTSKANIEMQRQLCRGGIRKGSEKWPQRWQAVLAFNPLCTSVNWRKLHGEEQDCVSVTGFGVTAFLMLIKLLHLRSEASSPSTRKRRTRCIAQRMNMQRWKN